MQFSILSTLLVLALVAVTTGQRFRCPQRTEFATCVGARNVGFRCPAVPPRRLWYYDKVRRACIDLPHLGCGGNSNRWCTRLACERRCNRLAILG